VHEITTLKTHPSQLGWLVLVLLISFMQGGPQRVLIVKKPVPAASALLKEMASWLEQRGLQVRRRPRVLLDWQ